MPAVPVKFRCYRCNQLLGVARARIGAVLPCPKCGAGLVVPDPDAPVPEAQRAAASAPSSTPSGAPEAGLDPDLLDIRPEDIRVEPGFDWVATSPPDPEPVAEEEAIPVLPIDTGPPPRPPGEAIPDLSRVAEPPSPTPAPSAEVAGPVVPPIRVETPGLAEARPAYGRSRDVVLPRSAVASWSLFVLLAQAFAFAAGLLAGHYLWRVH